MAQNDTVLNLVRVQTQQIMENGDFDGKGVDAGTLAIQLNADRANVSRTLNDLWREGLLIKFQGKPTLFLDRNLVADYHPGFFIPQTVAKGETLTDLIRAPEEADNDSSGSLDQLIGADTSLKDAIAQAKASLSYPPFGLHTVILGSAGVGKSKFAYCMYLYKKSAAPFDASIPFISVACHNFSGNPKLFSQQFLGVARDVVSNKSRRGFLDSAKGGILFFDEAQYLPPASLDLIVSVISRGSYSRLGDPVPRQIQCMVIAAAIPGSGDTSLPVLAKAMPVSIRMPDLEERGIYEKIRLIIRLFSDEAGTIHMPIKISRGVICLLAAMSCQRNITQLANEVKAACSRAYLDSRDKRHNTVYVHPCNLSRELLSPAGECNGGLETARCILEEIPDRYVEPDQNGISKYLETLSPGPPMAAAGTRSALEPRPGMDIESVDNIYETVIDSITWLSGLKDAKLRSLERSIYPIAFQVVTVQLQKHGKYEKSKKHLRLLYGILIHLTNFLKRDDIYTPTAAGEAPAASKDSFPEEYQMAADIMENLSQIYSCYFSNRAIDYLALYFAVFSNWTETVNLGLLVICHGETIASDMVSYALKAIHDDYIIDYINFSQSMSLMTCMALAAEKARQLNRAAGILIMTDMEPLTAINEYITRETGVDTNIIYPVTLPLLLKTIRQILANRSEFSLIPDTGRIHSTRSKNLDSQEIFIGNLVEKVISNAVVFLDIAKAVNVLEKCLKATLLDLRLPYSNEIAAKYLFHCCNMLERAIRRETWSYSRLNGFTNDHHELMYTVEHRLEYAENIFGIKIPAGEIAYVTEIFLQ